MNDLLRITEEFIKNNNHLIDVLKFFGKDRTGRITNEYKKWKQTSESMEKEIIKMNGIDIDSYGYYIEYLKLKYYICTTVEKLLI